MIITRRIFNRVALMLAGAKVLLSDASATALAQSPVALQPLAAQAKRVAEALRLIGEPLPADELAALNAAFNSANEEDGIQRIQQILDKHVLLNVQINPEDRVTLTRGSAKAQLMEQGWRTFLVKVSNEAADTSGLTIICPESLPMGTRSTGAIMPSDTLVDDGGVKQRWIALNSWVKLPMLEKLSGLAIEYRILQVYSRDHGQREANFRAQTTADALAEQYVYYYSYLPILFECLPSKDVSFHISDEDGNPTTASLLITDGLGRVYPAQGKRGQPDLWFERQIYRRDGESIRLAPGTYTVESWRGPEYLREKTPLTVGDEGTATVRVALKRWLKPSEYSYYSGDTHIHAAGCAHYETPTEGVTPEVIFRQVQGEALDVGDVLTWSGGFFYQRQFFSGHIRKFESAQSKLPRPAMPVAQRHAASTSAHASSSCESILRYDLEVSGFPSSHCGHLVLLRLSDQTYPGTKAVYDWPSWNLPILRWAKAQGAVAGYAHSGHGLVVDSQEIPNYLMPRFDGTGANEYVVDVTHGMVDFISVCDTLPHAELNIWYHTLNCGFRATLAGETDFPCLSDVRVGEGRSYVKLDARPTDDASYGRWISGIKEGRSYIGDGRSHIFDFQARYNDHDTASGREISAFGSAAAHVTARVCARLEPEISEATERIRKSPHPERPHWHIERARIGQTRKVAVELIVNGIAVQRSEIEADGSLQPVEFNVNVERSSWIAMRVLPSSHTNPIYVLVKNAPVRASRASAQWCRKAVDVCWEQKTQRMRSTEIDEAKVAYDHARSAYDRIVAESLV